MLWLAVRLTSQFLNCIRKDGTSCRLLVEKVPVPLVSLLNCAHGSNDKEWTALEGGALVLADPKVCVCPTNLLIKWAIQTERQFTKQWNNRQLVWLVLMFVAAHVCRCRSDTKVVTILRTFLLQYPLTDPILVSIYCVSQTGWPDDGRRLSDFVISSHMTLSDSGPSSRNKPMILIYSVSQPAPSIFYMLERMLADYHFHRLSKIEVLYRCRGQSINRRSSHRRTRHIESVYVLLEACIECIWNAMYEPTTRVKFMIRVFAKLRNLVFWLNGNTNFSIIWTTVWTISSYFLSLFKEMMRRRD
jgi:hypothetical protein